MELDLSYLTNEELQRELERREKLREVFKPVENPVLSDVIEHLYEALAVHTVCSNYEMHGLKKSVAEAVFGCDINVKLRLFREEQTIKKGAKLIVLSGGSIDARFKGDILTVTGVDDEVDFKWIRHTPNSFSGGGFSWNTSPEQHDFKDREKGFIYGVDFRIATVAEVDLYDH